MLPLALAAWAVGAAGAQGSQRLVAVIEVSRRPGTERWQAALAERVQGALAREGVPGLLERAQGPQRLEAAGLSDARSCQAARKCVARLAVVLGERAVVVGVDVARAGASLAVLVEALTGDEARVLASTDFLLPVGSWSDDAVVPIVRFARQLKEELAAEERARASRVAPAADAPVAVALAPDPRPAVPPAVIAPAPRQGPRALPWVLFGGTVAAAGAGATLLGLGLADRDAVLRSESKNGAGERVSELRRDQLTALEQGGNAKLTAALLSSLAAAALAIGTTAAFLTQD